MPIRFQVLPEELEGRVKKAFRALAKGKIIDVQGTKFFFKYFFERLKPMYRDKPKEAKAIKAALQDQVVGLIVPKFVNVTLHIKTIDELIFTEGVAPKDPAMIFDDLHVLEEMILVKTSIADILINKRMNVRKMAKVLKWLAPITTV